MISFFVLHLSDTAHAKKNDMILKKFRGDIEASIMKGYGQGWKHCDVVHDFSEPLQPDFLDETPTIMTDIDHLSTFDIRTTFSSSYCILVYAHVKSNQSLSDLIKFGWSVIQHKRLAIILKLSQGLTLDMATNTTKLPFLVAARMEGGGEQFICPVVGFAIPRLQNTMCDETYTSYRDKTLRVGTIGTPPQFFGKLQSFQPTINAFFTILHFKFYCSWRKRNWRGRPRTASNTC